PPAVNGRVAPTGQYLGWRDRLYWGVHPIERDIPCAYLSRRARIREVVLVTIGVVESEKTDLVRMIALTCESAGHRCLVFKDIAHVTRVLPATRLDTLVLDVERL